MMSPAKSFVLETDDDVLKRLVSDQPQDGLAQLIWNSIDADASSIDIVLDRGPMEGVDAVTITDDGVGFGIDVASEQLARFGGSAKGTLGVSAAGRELHGSKGEGRFHALWPGSVLVWESVTEDEAGDRLLVRVRTSAEAPQHGQIEGPEPTDRPRGTTVIIHGPSDTHGRLDSSAVADDLLVAFARDIRTYGLSITYDGTTLDPSPLIVKEWREDLGLVDDEPVTLEVLEWRKANVGKRLYLVDAEGAVCGDAAPRTKHRGFFFTAYLRWAGFGRTRASLPLAEIAGGSPFEVLESARAELRRIERQRASDRRSKILAKWDGEGVYPYTDAPRTQEEELTRETFDLVAYEAAEVIDKGSKKTKRLALSLIKQALESDPSSLQRVLTEVLDLPDERVEELAALLDETSLANIIQATRAITDRLKFVRSLALMTTSPEWKKRILERSQLHKILESHAWVFSDEYALTRSDKGLRSVLEAHIAHLGRDDLSGTESDPVLDTEGHQRVVDLMLSRVHLQGTRYKHLIVELKRPSVSVGPDELQQIKNYALAIASDHRYDKDRTDWEFWVVSTDVRGTVEGDRNQFPDQPGLAWNPNTDNVRVYVKKWGEVIHDARLRLEYVREQLQFDPTEQQTLDWLRQRHAEFIPAELSGSDAPAAA